MAVFDCMLLNSFFTWNLSCEKIRNWHRIKRHEFYTWIAEAMLHMTDEKVQEMIAKKPEISVETHHKEMKI